MSTKRIRLVVAYDGGGFCGWAAQPGLRSVQSTLRDAVRQISGEDCEIIGASRTDSGAHAKGQVCHFDTCCAIPPERWVIAMNRATPNDIAVVDSREAHPEFHSRFWAMDRWYRYRLVVGTKDPMRSRYSHQCRHQVDLKRMQDAARALVGRHDFRAYGEELQGVENTVRLLTSVQVIASRDEVHLDIVGQAFIRGMMRRIAGGLVEVGEGNRPVEQIGELLDPQRRGSIHQPVVLPACGLTLMRVRYGRHPKDCRDSKDDLIETE